MIRGLPKVVLHDHLDGGLRPPTLLALANRHPLPADTPEGIETWFHQGSAGSLERYLDAFEHTVAVMQDEAAIERVAFEAAEDLAADGAIYAELRFAPMLLTHDDLDAGSVLRAAARGLTAAEEVHGIVTGLIATAMRQHDDSRHVVEAAAGVPSVIGFDLAGPEARYPADLHAEACGLAAEAGLGITIHAGEADGPDSIRRALESCRAQRIGHGVRIIEDCVVRDGAIVDLGPVASVVHERRIPLEICPTSNLHTMHIQPAEHPVGLLHRAGFVVTISPDNRLMSGTSMSQEFELLVNDHGFTVDDLATVTRQSIDAAFAPPATREALWQAAAPAYRAAGASI